MLMVEGAAASVKLGPAFTVKGIAMLAVRLPDFPVTVKVVLAAAALALATSVRVLAPLELRALRVPVTPLGIPARVSVTAPEKPFCGVT